MADDREATTILISKAKQLAGLSQLRTGANLLRLAFVQIANAVERPPGPIGAMMTKSFMASRRPSKPEHDTTPV